MEHPAFFTCSAGDTQLALDPRDGSLHLCHRSFFFTDERYRKAIETMNEEQNYDIAGLRIGTLPVFIEKFVVRDLSELSELLYKSAAYHDFFGLRLNTVKSLILALANAGQIRKAYLDPELAEILALFISSAFACPADNFVLHGSMFISPIQLIRLWGNGSFETLLSQISRRK